ncbi:hypothetical protein [Thermosporothrix hazakensis]|jgi:hypothetical protein|nr:hypothetical protein [Thermosporothrix hazakensis]
MVPGKLPANAPCHPLLISYRHNAAWMRSVLQAISGASGVKSSAPEPLCSRRIHTNGSARFREHRERATAITEENCGRRYKGNQRIYQAQPLQPGQAEVRLDGQYGNGVIVADLAGLAYVMRGKDYDLLDLELVQARLAQLPNQQTTHPNTGTSRALFDFSDLSLSPTGPRTRVIVAMHQAAPTKAPVGTTRGELVYELFYTGLLPSAFTPADVVALYLHRGAFETVLADEDKEQDPDRWCSHTAWGRSSSSFSRNGCGTCAWNWVMCSIPRLCVRRNLLLPR